MIPYFAWRRQTFGSSAQNSLRRCVSKDQSSCGPHWTETAARTPSAAIDAMYFNGSLNSSHVGRKVGACNIWGDQKVTPAWRSAANQSVQRLAPALTSGTASLCLRSGGRLSTVNLNRGCTGAPGSVWLLGGTTFAGAGTGNILEADAGPFLPRRLRFRILSFAPFIMAFFVLAASAGK